MDRLDAWLAGQPLPEERPAAPLAVVRPDGAATPYAAKALASEVQRVMDAQEGGRNDQLNRSAFSLGQLVAGGEIGEAPVIEALLDAATAIGLPRGEAMKTVKSGLDSGHLQPRNGSKAWTANGTNKSAPAVTPRSAASTATPTTPSMTSEEPPAEVDAEAEDHGETVRRLFPLIDWHELWADDTEEEWILEPLLPARRLVSLYSPPKVGKSLLMLELAVCISKGAEALGTTPDRPYRVLYVDFENDPRGDIRERLQAMGFGPDDLGNLCYLSFPTLRGLDSEAGSLELMAAVEEYGCEVVVIDTVSRSVDGEENENDTWLRFYRHTGLKMKQAGISMIRLDHTGKDEAKGQRGGSAKVGDVDAVWKLSRVTDDTFRLTCEANRMPVAEKELTLTRIESPDLRHKVSGGGWQAAVDAAFVAAVQAMNDAGLEPDAGRNQARKVVKDARIKISNTALSKVCAWRKTCPGQVPTIALGPAVRDRLWTGEVDE